MDIVTSRTPLRISFAGGGTDLSVFSERHGGAVLSTTINKYLYVTVKKHGPLFNEKYRLNYSDTELSNTIDDIQNDIARECIRFIGIDFNLYISTISDIPGSSGLGSSSSFTVGLLNALHYIKGEKVSSEQLAAEACFIEIDVLKKPIGKQDQYAAAFGGLNYFKFKKNGSVTLEPRSLKSNIGSILFDSILIFWTGITRSADEILKVQEENSVGKTKELIEMRELSYELSKILDSSIDIKDFALGIDRGWQKKKKLAEKISSDKINKWYKIGIEAGSLGGKLLGAGGGGFLLFIVRPESKLNVRNALNELIEVDVQFEPNGSTIISNL